jgi:hypothetical protein
MLFVGRRRTTDMPSVEGVDDNVPPTGNGVRGGGGGGGSSSSSSSRGGYGEVGQSSNSYGVAGYSSNIGVGARSDSGIGVDCYSDSYIGVRGWSNSNIGVHGYSDNSYGVYTFSNGEDRYALYAGSSFGYAAWLNGEVNIRGPLIKPGGRFEIDHPLDPANKYLSHCFVESPDMKNVYDGTVVLDYKGEAEVELPDWFGALNQDFRYQLTAIGAPSIRKDPWANANRIQVEEDKPFKEQGYYMYPDLYGQPEEKGVNRLLFPEEEKWQEQLVNEKAQ